MIYSIPKSRGYRAGKKGDLRIPPLVLFLDIPIPEGGSVPLRCILFPDKKQINILII